MNRTLAYCEEKHNPGQQGGLRRHRRVTQAQAPDRNEGVVLGERGRKAEKERGNSACLRLFTPVTASPHFFCFMGFCAVLFSFLLTSLPRSLPPSLSLISIVVYILVLTSF